MSKISQKRLHIGFAVPIALLGVAAAIGKPLVSPGVSWVIMALIALAWLITGIILFSRDPSR